MKIVSTNKKIALNYNKIVEFSCGIMILGTEIKSIRTATTDISDGYCFIKNMEMFCTGLYIKQYKQAFKDSNHDPKRLKKLLLKKQETHKIYGMLTKKPYLTIIPSELFINEKGIAKLNIWVCEGLKKQDQRQKIKEKDIERDIAKNKKLF